jgi:eukaryotic-like serine/threonine-protein kinase
MAHGFEETYTITGDLPAGDALKAQRAVTAEGAEVVVKTVRPVAPAMFASAIARVAGVASPHLERVLGWEQQDEFISVAVEPVGGTDLGRVLAAAGTLAPHSAAALGAQAALGLAALHQQGIVHGAVKPSTLVQAPDERVVLVDTGLAQAQGGADLTEEAPPRNAYYVSPEEVLGRQLVPASDVYCLGVVLYQCVTGRVPFDGKNAFAVAQDHVGAPVTPPRQLNPAVPTGLENVILRALAKPPEDRFSSGRQLYQALEDELQGTQVVAPIAAPAAQPRRPRWPWIVGGIVLVAAVIVAVLWASGAFTQKVTVPNVVGLTLANATSTLDNAGFKLGTVGYQQGVGKPQGTILSQAPTAGASADKGSAVRLVAVGTSVQTVPNVIGMTQSAAAAAITGAGLSLGHISSIYSAGGPAGTVTGQAPSAGITAPAGSQVAITVSKGPAPSASPSAAAVPNVIGQSQSQAVATLQAAGFAAVVDQVPSTTVPAGTVSDQTPASGVLAQPGTTVTIVVSTGAPSSSPTP